MMTKLNEAARMATEVPIEVTVSERLSFDAAKSALDLTRCERRLL